MILFAILPDGSPAAPSGYGAVYTAPASGEIPAPGSDGLYAAGLPKRGDNWSLWEHAEPRPGSTQSAFRGATAIASDPVAGQGAAYWTDEGGVVVEVEGSPWWDVNALLAHQIPTPGLPRGPLMHGENEFALPGLIPPNQVARVGTVRRTKSARLWVQWVPRH